MSDAINVGAIQADLQIDSGNVAGGLSAGRAAIAAFRKELKELAEAFTATGGNEQEFIRRTQVVEQEIANLRSAMAPAYASLGQLGDAFDILNQKANAKSADAFAKTTEKVAQANTKLGAMFEAFQAKKEAYENKQQARDDAAIAKKRSAYDRLFEDLVNQVLKEDAALEKKEVKEVAAISRKEAREDAARLRNEAKNNQAIARQIAKDDEAIARQNAKEAAAFVKQDASQQAQIYKSLVDHVKENDAAMAKLGQTARTSADIGRAAYGGWGQAMMQFGYMIDDVQYGLKNILNNVAPLTQSVAGALGATAQTASMIGGVTQIAAVAVYQLYTHWDQLMEAMGSPVLRSRAEEMDILAKKTEKTAEETKKLADYEERLASARTRTGAESEVEKEAEAKTTKAIGEAGGGERVRGGIEKSLLESGEAELSEADRKAVVAEVSSFSHAVGGLFGDPTLSAEEDLKRSLRKKKAERLKERSGDILAGKRPEDRETMMRLVREHPENFEPGTLGALEAATPEGIKEAELAKAKEKMDREEAETDAAARKAGDATEKREKAGEDARAREWRKENVEVAKQVLPGFDEKSKDIAASYARSGRSKKEAIANMTSELKLGKDGRTMTEEDAYAAAKDTVGKEFDEFKADPHKLKAYEKRRGKDEEIPGFGEHMKDLLKSSGPGKSRLAQFSEVGNLSDMTAKIQAGIGGESDVPKQQLDVLKKVEEYMKMVAEKKSVEVRVA